MIINMFKFKDKGNIFKYYDFIEYINEIILGKGIRIKFLYEDIKDLYDNDLLQYVSDFLIVSYYR